LEGNKGISQRKGLLTMIREFLYGLAVHEHVTVAVKEKTSMNHLFMLVIFGDMLGVPVIPPYYALRLLPYAFPMIHSWQRTVLKERDWSDWSFD